jgi:hypothetical protein
MAAPWNDRAHTYIPVPALAVVANPDGLAEQPVSIRAIISHVQKLRGPRAESLVSKMRHRRRKVFIDTHKGRVSAGFTVAAEADAAGSPIGCGSKPSSMPGSRPSSTGHAARHDSAVMI